MRKEFATPGPGTWMLETTHFSTAVPRSMPVLFAEGIGRGFREGMEKYGLAFIPADAPAPRI